MSFYLPFFCCPWSFLFILSLLIWYLNVVGNYALGIQRNMVLYCNSCSSFLLKTQTALFINVFLYLTYAEAEMVGFLPSLLPLAIFAFWSISFRFLRAFLKNSAQAPLESITSLTPV